MPTIPITVNLSGPTVGQIEILVREALKPLEAAGIRAAPCGAFGLPGHDHDDLQVFFLHTKDKTDVVIATIVVDLADPQHAFIDKVKDILATVARENGIPFAC